MRTKQENASDILADKINNGTPFEKDGKQLVNKKTLDGFMKYASSEAKKLTEKGANSACVEDSVVCVVLSAETDEKPATVCPFDQDQVLYLCNLLDGKIDIA